jgi:hypothetical protein
MCYFTEDGLLVKMTNYSEQAPRLQTRHLRIWEKMLRTAARPLKKKLYSREFLSLDTLFDAIFIGSSIESKVRLRIPLSCMIDYQGFRAIVVAVPPI